ncbi:rhamnogalacturonan acetylesterase [Horticoccus luteus]|uniref:Rhamnogalacturonan acetylesterase n=1 Tax=Horticoccus luteus TaxID=2862869 RepID=A0A8F9XIM1_9BACT|nr:rhamnogalacturonan acetylesterase [Horticoccus luteus]QYM77738.1 rhamnogalacturonan acetylesterase [Horticoccus luteus]
MKKLLALLLLPFLSAHGNPRHFDLSNRTPDDAFSASRGFGYDLGTAPTPDKQPFFFSVAVPEGNYRVTITFGGPTAGDTTVKAESRRLMLEHVLTAPGETVSRDVIVNVRTPALPPPPPNAPGGTAVALNDREHGSFTWDAKLTLEFDGAPLVRRISVEPVEVPTVFLAGDSTVTDQRWEDGASWGQMLPRFLTGVAVANHAESGETLKSFLSELRLAKILSQLQAGDYLFIQFGHNDEKKNWPQTYVEAHTTYQAYLRVFIAEARLRGAMPVLVTSMQRRTFDAHGKIRNTHGDYTAAVRAVAAEEHVPLIDLDRLSVAFYETLGPARAHFAFGNHGREATHHNNYGAYELAKCVAQGLRTADLPLAAHLAPDFTGFDPAQPDDPQSFHLPASPLHSDVRPRGN